MKWIVGVLILLTGASSFAQNSYPYLPKEYQNTTTDSKKKVKTIYRKKRTTKTSINKKLPKVTTVTKETQKPKFRKYSEKISFNYYAQYLGPSLDSNYQSGATYNRFKTGQDLFENPQDSTASHQLFHSIAIGYQFTTNLKLVLSSTFQEDLNSDIKYEVKNLDGTSTEYDRIKGVSDNNKRVNLLATNLFSNSYFTINSNQFIELASTYNSEGNDMDYGIGVQPSINFKLASSSFFTGISASIQRNYYKEQEYFQKCGDQDCLYATRYQTLLVDLSAYANYVLNDYVTLKSSLNFDWDQKGNQVEDLQVFNKNMDDVGRVGIDFHIDYGITAGTFLEFALEDANISKTALGLTLNVMIF